MKKIVLLLLIAVAQSTNANSFSTCAAPLAIFNKEGSVLAGSRDELLNAYRSGREIRVGWRLDWDNDGEVDITHWSTPPFISEFHGELFAQVGEIHRQITRTVQGDVLLSDQWQKWTGMVDTKGVLQGRMREEQSVRTWKVESHWCEIDD